jgi:hypothetical protein
MRLDFGGSKRDNMGGVSPLNKDFVSLKELRRNWPPMLRCGHRLRFVSLASLAPFLGLRKVHTFVAERAAFTARQRLERQIAQHGC